MLPKQLSSILELSCATAEISAARSRNRTLASQSWLHLGHCQTSIARGNKPCIFGGISSFFVIRY